MIVGYPTLTAKIIFGENTTGNEKNLSNRIKFNSLRHSEVMCYICTYMCVYVYIFAY